VIVVAWLVSIAARFFFLPVSIGVFSVPFPPHPGGGCFFSITLYFLGNIIKYK